MTLPTPPEAVPTREQFFALINHADGCHPSRNQPCTCGAEEALGVADTLYAALASSLAREAALQQELIVVGQASVEAHGEDLEKLRAENTALREAMECWQSYSSHQEWCRACAEDSVGSCTEGVALKNSALLASPSDPTEGQTNG